MSDSLTIVYWIWLFVVGLSLAYTLAFDRATLFVGRLISRADGGSGLQNAITPPGHTFISLFVYAAWLLGAILWIWRAGWIAGLGGAFGVFVLACATSGMFPKKDSSYFMRKISRSLASRHNFYVARGDELRAAMLSDLMDRIELNTGESAR